MVVLYEIKTMFRQIYMDGRTLQPDAPPTWLGYSTGKWEGDVLVVRTAGFNDKTWLDDNGPPALGISRGHRAVPTPRLRSSVRRHHHRRPHRLHTPLDRHRRLSPGCRRRPARIRVQRKRARPAPHRALEPVGKSLPVWGCLSREERASLTDVVHLPKDFSESVFLVLKFNSSSVSRRIRFR